MASDVIPYIDPNVEHVGVSRLRELDSKSLRANQKALVIRDKNTPLAVLLTYEQYLCMQKQIESVLSTLEMLSDENELQSAITGMEELMVGKTEPLSNIRRALKAKKKG